MVAFFAQCNHSFFHVDCANNLKNAVLAHLEAGPHMSFPMTKMTVRKHVVDTWDGFESAHARFFISIAHMIIKKV